MALDTKLKEKQQMATAQGKMAVTSTQITHHLPIGYVFWLFGFTGAHRFYYGRPISGIVYLLTFGLLGIGWLIDIFLIPSMDEDANRRYRPGQFDYTVSWLLLAFAGAFGVHRMYLGSWISGVIYLLTGGLCGLGIVYDFCTLNDQVDQANTTVSVG